MATTTTTTAPTGWAADAAFSNWQRAQGISSQPYQPYTGNMLAGWSPGQEMGYNAILNGAGVGMPAQQQAQGAALNAAQWGPQQVQGGGYQATLGVPTNTQAASAGPAAQGTAQNFTDANLGAYMNPYTGQVIDRTLQTLGRQNDILQNTANAKASAAGAFGGSRQAIMNSENNRNFLDTAATTTANLNNQNFAQAQSAIAADQNRQAQMSQYNTGAQNQMAQYNAGNAQTAYNQTADAHTRASLEQARAVNQASEYGLDQSLRGQMANQQAGQNAINSQISAANALNGMGLDEQKRAQLAAQAQWTMGNAGQQQEQSYLDNAYNQWVAQQNYPMNQLGVLQQGLNGYSSGTTQTSPYYSNTGANVLAGALGAGALGAGILQNGSAIVSGAKDLWGGVSSLWA